MSAFKWRQFAGEVILWAVRWYCRYGISYRELEEMLGERGVAVDHTTIYRWVQRYSERRSAMAKQNRVRPSPGSRRAAGRAEAAWTPAPVGDDGHLYRDEGQCFIRRGRH
jgi:hypothetical protein